MSYVREGVFNCHDFTYRLLNTAEHLCTRELLLGGNYRPAIVTSRLLVDESNPHPEATCTRETAERNTNLLIAGVAA